MASKIHRTYPLNIVGNMLENRNLKFSIDQDTMILTTKLDSYQLNKHPTKNYWYATCNGYKVQVMIKPNSGILHTWF